MLGPLIKFCGKQKLYVETRSELQQDRKEERIIYLPVLLEGGDGAYSEDDRNLLLVAVMKEVMIEIVLKMFCEASVDVA